MKHFCLGLGDADPGVGKAARPEKLRYSSRFLHRFLRFLLRFSIFRRKLQFLLLLGTNGIYQFPDMQLGLSHTRQISVTEDQAYL